MNFKFGVLYAKTGQVTDNEMFSNGESCAYIVCCADVVKIIIETSAKLSLLHFVRTWE